MIGNQRGTEAREYARVEELTELQTMPEENKLGLTLCLNMNMRGNLYPFSPRSATIHHIPQSDFPLGYLAGVEAPLT